MLLSEGNKISWNQLLLKLISLVYLRLIISNESKSHLLFAEIPGYCVGFGCDVRKEEDVIKLVSKVIV